MSAVSGLRTKLGVGLALLLAVAYGAGAGEQPGPAVAGPGVQAAAPINDDNARHRALIEEAERNSRAFVQPPPGPPRNGIRQFPLSSLERIVGPIPPKPGAANRAASAALVPPPPPKLSTCLQKTFPFGVSGPGGVSWIVCLTDLGHKALAAGPVLLQRTPPSGPWLVVLNQASLAEIFVPYHDGDIHHRFYDLMYTQQLAQLTQQDAGVNGSLISLGTSAPPTVVAEVRDRGLAWLCKQKSMASRRGEEFVVWAMSDAGNYDNIVQFGFRDDGTMTFRVGHTGYNEPLYPLIPHMHTSLWRVDIDLNGWSADSAYLTQHREPAPGGPLVATDVTIPFTGGKEGFTQWYQQVFNSLLIEDGSTNSSGKHIGYEFQPLVTGTARHFGPVEFWTTKDFFVSVYEPNSVWQTGVTPDQYLIPEVSDHQSVLNNDLVAWVVSAAHHDPTDEDNGPNSGRGVTLIHWSGFDAVPHNLFDANPLGAPASCD
jgi:primary-amine oxidase